MRIILIEFVAGLSIIAEIIGREKIEQYQAKLNVLINLKKIFVYFYKSFLWVYGFVKYGYFDSKPPYFKYFQKIIKDREGRNIDKLKKKDFLRYRQEVAAWKIRHRPIFYNAFKERREKTGYVIYLLITGLAYFLYFSITWVKDVYGEFNGIAFIAAVILALFIAAAASGLSVAILSTIILLGFECIKFLSLSTLELILFRPIIFYLTLSQKEKKLKTISFGLVAFAFLLSFFTS